MKDEKYCKVRDQCHKGTQRNIEALRIACVI